MKQVIVLRKDLNMRKGKMVAQGAHASEAAIFNTGLVKEFDGVEYLCIPLTENVKPWLIGNFKKIVVSVDSEQELLDIYNIAKENNILTSLIKDSGLTEFNGVPTLTAVAVGPDEESKIDKVTKHLKLL